MTPDREVIRYIVQGSDAWHELRRQYANASTAAVHMRDHEYMTIADWFTEKLTGERQTVSWPMERGTRMERFLLDQLTRDSDITFVTDHNLYRYGRLLYSPDGVNQAGGIYAEVKASCPDGGVPAYRWWQCIAELLCTGADAVVLYEWGERDKRQTWFHADEHTDDMARLYEAVERDMEFLDMGVLPPGTEFTTSHMKAIYREPEPGLTVDLPGEQAGLLLTDLAETKAMIQRLTDLRDKLEANLEGWLGKAEIGLIDGHPAVTWKSQTRTSLDTKRLTADLPDIADKYKTTTSYRVLRPKGLS